MKTTTDDRLELYFKIKRKGLRLNEVSKMMGVSPSLISQYLNNKVNMSLYNETVLKELLDK
ncbi:helix-turn-helix domain-containing protein [Psychrobacillus sp. L3]|uniref:helix-turn-helix domain-containing protein n=1 Tax=Psychrobacillus sp. L3 TaxID=3236891 RepID=UPI0036F1F422